MLFQHTGVLQGVHGVSGKTGHLTGQNHVKLMLLRILDHPHEFATLFCGCAGDAFINISLNQCPFRMVVQQRLVPIKLIFQCRNLGLMLG